MVIPGALREESVKVGYHQPPGHGSLKLFLDRFGEFYTPDRHHGALKLVAAAAAHHRLMLIHPFLDGNGRVARLFTEAYFHRIPVHGFGLWSVSRGLARRNVDYKSTLARADAPRRNDLDGRGKLSNEGLIYFCRFFLEVCLDQVEYMGGLLRLEELVERIRRYVELRSSGMISGPIGEMGLRAEAAREKSPGTTYRGRVACFGYTKRRRSAGISDSCRGMVFPGSIPYIISMKFFQEK